MSVKRGRKTTIIERSRSESAFVSLWDYFWHKPEQRCPSCGAVGSEYYDPFFFAPIRTLNGKRRLKCLSCKFIWRPKKSEKSFLEKIFPRI